MLAKSIDVVFLLFVPAMRKRERVKMIPHVYARPSKFFFKRIQFNYSIIVSVEKKVGLPCQIFLVLYIFPLPPSATLIFFLLLCVHQSMAFLSLVSTVLLFFSFTTKTQINFSASPSLGTYIVIYAIPRCDGILRSPYGFYAY